MHPLVERLAAELAAVVPREIVAIDGAWSSATRRTYRSPAQQGGGEGPFVEVMDVRWRGIAQCAAPLAGYAFLITPAEAFWVKSSPPQLDPSVEVSLHAWADGRLDRASFVGRLTNAFPPSVAVPCGPELVSACTLGSPATVTGRLHLVAAAEGAEFAVLLVPRSVVKVGRNRLWRLRDEVASALSADVRGRFWLGRTGALSEPERG